MVAVVGRRDSGKTIVLINLAAREGAVIACKNRVALEACKRLAKRMGVVIPEPITHFELLYQPEKMRGLRNPIVIDDLESFLIETVPIPRQFIAVALTGDAIVLRDTRPTVITTEDLPGLCVERTRAIEKVQE